MISYKELKEKYDDFNKTWWGDRFHESDTH